MAIKISNPSRLTAPLAVQIFQPIIRLPVRGIYQYSNGFAEIQYQDVCEVRTRGALDCDSAAAGWRIRCLELYDLQEFAGCWDELVRVQELQFYHPLKGWLVICCDPNTLWALSPVEAQREV